ncbi:MAG TPA: right-handed parallel beta-helix repeat-containing protein [Methanofastidiosum sp.]|jgi:parallel beta-helix repeat protein|nr:right-handed parallel beta-helix repeat-containing protein [Methanofastidiosum sp.]HPX24486.1 right-handed parallel beta-helix repeat-containing protein [Methanofastidiosum sp.]HQC25454.1 right-handed parallel beta-helix repeat-containing protein [Methanofastidiosum sp.]HQF88891.1 right-handed parallel beta-helix repeat-containing protein [Methanofastidiosum sp.]HQG60628.1 right-handed parallel beta-helix repeat-containing protein [Methanofastidiosum sp.]
MKKIKSLILGILLLVSMLIVINPVSAATVTINPGGSIQTAIDSASPGDTILVNPGTYKGNLIVYKPGLTIKSTGGPAVTIIDASQIDPCNYERSDCVAASGCKVNYGDSSLNHNGFNVWADNVTIEGFTILNAAYPSQYNKGIGILIGSINTTYFGYNPYNIDIWGGLYTGSPGGGQNIISRPTGVTIRNNIIDGASDGIYIWSSSGNLIEYNVVKNLIPLGGDGIILYDGGKNNTIRCNTVEKAVNGGIKIMGNTWDSQYVYPTDPIFDTSGTQVYCNIIKNISTGAGIEFGWIAGTNIVAYGNTVDGNLHGFLMEGPGGATIPKIYNNNILNNTTGGSNIASNGPLDMSNNYWQGNTTLIAGDIISSPTSQMSSCTAECTLREKGLPKNILYPKLDIEKFSVNGGPIIIQDGKVVSSFSVAPGTQQTTIEVKNRGLFTLRDVRIRFDGMPQDVTVSTLPETQKIKGLNTENYSIIFNIGPNVPSGTYDLTVVVYSEKGVFDTIAIKLVVS